jgi:signal transduction histidine kinase
MVTPNIRNAMTTARRPPDRLLAVVSNSKSDRLHPRVTRQTIGPDAVPPAEPDAVTSAANGPLAVLARPSDGPTCPSPPDLFATFDTASFMRALTRQAADLPVRRRRQTVALPDGHAVLALQQQVAAPAPPDKAVLPRWCRRSRPSGETERLRSENAQLRNRNAELERLNERLRQFNRIAAHDLMDPIAKLMRGVAILRDAGERGEALDTTALSIVAVAANRVSTQVGDLVDYCSVSEGPIERAALMLAPLLQALATEAGTPLDLIFDVPADLALRADPRLARQIFLNLISNAVKFRDPDRPLRMRVSATPVAGGFEVRIEDNGIGFPQSSADGLFAPFRRLRGGANVPGRGLGLPIAATAAVRHGWSIRAEGHPGEGANFAVLIPDRDIERVGHQLCL